jgi:hypothetical protein
MAYVLAIQTQKKYHTPIFALAAALNPLTRAPGTGPLLLALGMCVVFSRAFTAIHMASSDIAAARQTRSCRRCYQTDEGRGLTGLYDCHHHVLNEPCPRQHRDRENGEYWYEISDRGKMLGNLGILISEVCRLASASSGRLRSYIARPMVGATAPLRNFC